jgi:LuxR family quorum-sensing system transcriptional regulator CciR
MANGRGQASCESDPRRGGRVGELNDIQAFIDASGKVKTSRALSLLLEQITRDMGFDYYALVHHVDLRAQGTQRALWLENYPRSWAEVFVATGLYAHDPILVASHVTNVGFAWSDVPSMIRLTKAHKNILLRVRREGLGDGFTVPAHVPGEANGSCNFAMAGSAAIPRTILPMAQLVGSYAFQAARKLVLRSSAGHDAPRPKLTSRQIECVALIAQGQSDRQIAATLGLKPATVNEYVEDACRRYNVSRRIQLAFHAVHDGYLTLADALNSKTTPLLPG